MTASPEKIGNSKNLFDSSSYDNNARLSPDDFAYYNVLRSSLATTTDTPTSPEESLSTLTGTEAPRTARVVERTPTSSILRVTETAASTTIRLMHVALLTALTFSPLGGSIDQVPRVDQLMFSRVKAALLAQYHFNNRLPDVVPNLPELLTLPNGQPCNVKMTLGVFDTAASPLQGAQVLLNQVLGPPPSAQQQQQQLSTTTAVVGPWSAGTAASLGVLATARSLPTVSPRVTAARLNDRSLYRLWGRVVPSDDGLAQLAVDFLEQIPQSNHVGLLFLDDFDASAYRLAVEQAAQRAGIRTQAATLRRGDTNNNGSTSVWEASVETAVAFLKRTGFRHFLAHVFPAQLRMLVEVATREGIMGPGYLWLLGEAISPSAIVDVSQALPPSVASVGLQGLALLNLGDSSSSPDQGRRFRRAYRSVQGNPDFQQYFASHSPSADVCFPTNATTGPPASFSEYVYDAVLALGIAACRLPEDDGFFTGPQLFQQFLQVTFRGASGPVRINPQTGTRFSNSTTYMIRNTRVDVDPEDGTVRTRTMVAFEYTNEKKDDNVADDDDNSSERRRWIPVSLDRAFQYSDNSTTAPPSLPPVAVHRVTFETEFRVFSAVACFIMVAALGFAAWTWRFRKSRIIKASQPEFLLSICFGEILMAFAAITLGAEHPPQRLEWADFSCMATQWFFAVGYATVFSALFAKTWRIHKLLGSHHSYRHVVVESRDVIMPGICIVFSSLVVLTVWQINDPLRYILRFDENDDLDRFGRPTKLIAMCESTNGTDWYYATALFLIAAVATLASNVQAYRARGITTEFSESVYIALAMAINLQALAVALPVLFYDTDPKSDYIARSTIVTLIPASSLFVIFVPKVAFWRNYRKKRKERQRRRQERSERSEMATAEFRATSERTAERARVCSAWAENYGSAVPAAPEPLGAGVEIVAYHPNASVRQSGRISHNYSASIVSSLGASLYSTRRSRQVVNERELREIQKHVALNETTTPSDVGDFPTKGQKKGQPITTQLDETTATQTEETENPLESASDELQISNVEEHTSAVNHGETGQRKGQLAPVAEQDGQLVRTGGASQLDGPQILETHHEEDSKTEADETDDEHVISYLSEHDRSNLGLKSRTDWYMKPEDRMQWGLLQRSRFGSSMTAPPVTQVLAVEEDVEDVSGLFFESSEFDNSQRSAEAHEGF